MDKYIIAPPAGSTNNAIGANDRKWAKGYFDELPDWQDYLAEATGYGIVRGCNPSITGLVVSVGNGLVHMYTGKRKEFAAATVTLDAADSTDPRIDLVYLDENGALQKSTGTAAESPLPPAVPDNAIAVCTVTVEAAASTGTILDCRGIKYRQPNTTYAEKAIAFCVGLPTGWYLEVATPGETSNAGIALPSPVVENLTINDGTVVWKLRRLSSADGDGVAVGIILPFAGNGDIPSGYLLCDGAAYSRTALPDLFAAIGTDYGSGDGLTTFNVPDANQAKRFLQGDTVAGTVKNAGLPNITGSTGNFVMRDNTVATGAFSFNTTSTNRQVLETGNSIADINIDASRSSPIYGNSTTVQPDALTTRYIIKAFDGQTADSALINITQFENELGGKADRSLSNLTAEGLAKLVGELGQGTNGYQKLGSGLIIQWGRGQSGSNGIVKIIYPIAFPNKVVAAQGIHYTTAAQPIFATIYEAIEAYALTEVSFMMWSASSNSIVAADVYWIAIGY